MADIFSPTSLAGIQLNNRVLRSATDEALADDKGFVTEPLIQHLEKLAKGGIGGIITGFMAVSADGEAPHEQHQVMIDDDSRLPMLTTMVERIHAAGAPVIAQLVHCGSSGISGKAFNVDKLPVSTLERVRQDFVDAAVRAKKAGFDGIQLHCAHGYFLSQTLSAAANHRKDAYGGTEEKRFRLTGEIIRAIKETLPDYPLLVKMNGEEQPKNGIHADEAVRLAVRLQEAGADAIEVSRGLGWTQMGACYGKAPAEMILHDYPGMKGIPSWLHWAVKPLIPKIMDEKPTARMYNVETAVKIKQAVNIPVIAVGGIHDLSEIEQTLDRGIDFVAMSRPLILEPNLINKYKEQKSQQARCIECNHCLIGIYARPLRCYFGKLPK